MKNIFPFENKLNFGFSEFLRFLRKVISISRFMRIKVKFYLIPLILLTLVVNIPFDAFAQAPKTKFKVVIDPGHGGKDWGTRGEKVKEKDVVL
ncbi:MAG TPA: hypothetical protein VIN11_03460, partial [Roseivirga sp.]